MVQIKYWHGTSLAKANLFCRHITDSPQDCYYCCGNAHSCRQGDEKWTSYIATTPKLKLRQCICCYHGADDGFEPNLQPLTEDIHTLHLQNNLTNPVIHTEKKGKEEIKKDLKEKQKKIEPTVDLDEVNDEVDLNKLDGLLLK